MQAVIVSSLNIVIMLRLGPKLGARLRYIEKVQLFLPIAGKLINLRVQVPAIMEPVHERTSAEATGTVCSKTRSALRKERSYSTPWTSIKGGRATAAAGQLLHY
ncbi:hypothetical protein R1flu_010582 [Riccia fluitans]|uniref:Uncharacterized protein n=1 Tax=Riccia fluitans TaxID=41844 RepID=A0ABD1Z652_9MARC